jgi:hypothetical protein
MSLRILTISDGRPVTPGAITHITRTRLAFQNHLEDITIFVTKLAHHPIVLGIPWLRQHDVCLCLAQNKLIFNPNYYLSHCFDDALQVQGTTRDLPQLHLNSIARPLGYTVLDVQETWKVISPEYHDFLPLFPEEGSRCLLPKRPSIDHEIHLKADFQQSFGPLYGLSQAEPKATKEWLDNNLKKGFI